MASLGQRDGIGCRPRTSGRWSRTGHNGCHFDNGSHVEWSGLGTNLADDAQSRACDGAAQPGMWEYHSAQHTGQCGVRAGLSVQSDWKGWKRVRRRARSKFAEHCQRLAI